MNKQPAKVLEPAELRRVLKHIHHTRHPTRNRAMVLLSFKAGLRACEIAGFSWPMVLTSGGKLGPTVNVSRHIAKQGRARRIRGLMLESVGFCTLRNTQSDPKVGDALSKSEQQKHTPCHESTQRLIQEKNFMFLIINITLSEKNFIVLHPVLRP